MRIGPLDVVHLIRIILRGRSCSKKRYWRFAFSFSSRLLPLTPARLVSRRDCATTARLVPKRTIASSAANGRQTDIRLQVCVATADLALKLSIALSVVNGRQTITLKQGFAITADSALKKKIASSAANGRIENLKSRSRRVPY